MRNGLVPLHMKLIKKRKKDIGTHDGNTSECCYCCVGSRAHEQANTYVECFIDE